MSDRKYKYGLEGKKVVFVEDDKRYADFRIRLRHDGITQNQFFQYIVSCYLNSQENMNEIVNSLRSNISKHGKQKINKSKKLLENGEDMLRDFEFSSEEKEKIFDMIMEELEH